MNEFSAQIFDQLDAYTPEPDRWPDWRDVVWRARKQRKHRLVVALAAAVIVLGCATAVTAALGGFDSWLSGTPGRPAPRAEQERFDVANRSLNSFPKGTKLRELVRAKVGGKQYELYGFRSGSSVCLRLKAVSLGHSIGPTCAPVSKVKRATAPLVVVVGNDGFQNRHGRPSAAVSFGIAADSVSRVEVRAVDGVHRAALGGNAYLWVDNNPNSGQRVFNVTAVRAGGSRITVPLSGAWGFYSADTAPDRPPRGPARVEVKIPHPTVGWFVRNERRGVSLGEVRKGLPRSTSLYTNGLESTRLVKPDPLSNALVGLTGRWCLVVYQRGGPSNSCTPGREFWSLGPLNVLLSGEGDEYVRISGVAADGVEHVTVFLASGERQRAAFKDNLFTTLVPAAEFPARIVAYDRQGRVAGVLTWRWDIGGSVPPAAARNLQTVMRVTGPSGATAIARVGHRVRGYRCWRVDISTGQAPGGCSPRIFGPSMWVNVVQPAGHDLFVIGHASASVKRVQLEFTNGDVIRARPAAGLFVIAIPRDQLRPERQLAFAEAYAAKGKRIQRQSVLFKAKP